MKNNIPTTFAQPMTTATNSTASSQASAGGGNERGGGALITKPMVDWCVKNLSNLTTANIGAGIHYLQEDNPHAIGLEIAKWYEPISR